MDFHTTYRRKITCEECGKVFQGMRSFEGHKPECIPVEPVVSNPCSCFDAGVNYFCTQHEGDE